MLVKGATGEFFCHCGGGGDGYNTIRGPFASNMIGTYTRAILVNPLHPDLPRIPVVLHPTSNKFDPVSKQWQQIDAWYKGHLKPVWGSLIGHSSDGDSRWRKVMLHETRHVPWVNRFQSIQQEDFIITCYPEPVAELKNLTTFNFIDLSKIWIGKFDFESLSTNITRKYYWNA